MTVTNHRNRALKAALAVVERLPLALQRQLAERLVEATASNEDTTLVYLHRLPSPKQQRLALLMDKSNEGRLSQAEQSELKRLGAEVEKLLLANSEALARALRPELFGAGGRPVQSRVRQAVREVAPGRAEPRRQSAHA